MCDKYYHRQKIIQRGQNGCICAQESQCFSQKYQHPVSGVQNNPKDDFAIPKNNQDVPYQRVNLQYP
jgi:hypothetical protein